METWMITGGDGFLGKRAAAYLQGRKKTIVCSHRELDFTDEVEVEHAFLKYRPDVLLHTGAISDTGLCEKNPEVSYKVNVKGPKLLAKACERYGVKLIACSSDQVYAGAEGLWPHREDEAFWPSNVYGRHKLEAERDGLYICPDSVWLRLSWMYDIPAPGEALKPNFVTNLQKAVAGGQEIVQPVHDYRGITDVHQVIENLEVCREFPGGVYNWGSENRLNTYELTRAVLKLWGVEGLVKEDPDRFREAPRNLCMDMHKASALGAKFPGTLAGILACLQRNER